MKPGATGFDVARVAAKDGDLTFSPEEFGALPLDQRLRFILERRVEFFRDGETIPGHVALGRLGL